MAAVASATPGAGALVCRAVFAVLLFTPGLAGAQQRDSSPELTLRPVQPAGLSGHPGRWVADSGVTRLAWGSVNVLVQADTVSGVRLWAQTSSLGYRGEPRAFVASFDPAAVEPWLDRANLVVRYQGAPPADSVLALETPPLTANDGSQLVLIRRRSKRGWQPRLTILLVGPGDVHSWSISARPEEASSFLNALFHRLPESRFQPELVAEVDANPFRADQCPYPLAGNPIPEFPVELRHVIGESEVWLTFVVLADGSPDATSFHAIMYDRPAFVDASVAALLRSRYSPGKVNGQPVPVRVSQRVVFRLY